MKPGLLAALAFGAALACGSSGPKPEALVGTWDASKMAVAAVANPAMTADLKAKGGTATLVLTDTKTFMLTISEPGQSDLVLTGNWSSSVDVLTLNFTGGPFTGQMQFDMSLSGDVLNLSGAHMPYDVNGDGMPEECLLSLTMARQ